MKKDRYHPLFCKPDFYSANQSNFKNWKMAFANLSDVEKIKAWTVCLTCLRRPDDWFGGLRQFPFQSDFKENQNADFKISSLLNLPNNKTKMKWPTSLPIDLSVQDFLNRCRIKPLPEAALRSLYMLGSEDYPLLITTHEPTPFELLQIQIKGKRVITFSDDYENWPHKIYGERDVLSFVIHDLIHADHFFKDPFQRKGQIGFYKLIQKIQCDNQLQKLLQIENFKSGFEYIISDMNSHPVHLLQTLKALLFLTLVDDKKSEFIWNQWILTWSNDATACDALQKINTQLFSNINANQIQDMCFNESDETSLATTNSTIVN